MAAERKKLSSESLFPPKKAKKRIDMSNSNNNQLNVPQAREASDLGSRMVMNMCPRRSARFDRLNHIAPGHVQTVQYIALITI